MALNLSGTTGIVTGNIAALQVTTATIADANVTPGKLSQPMTLGTVQNATGSNTFFDFTGIPSWAKRVTIIFNGVSTNGSASLLIQLGTSSGFVTTGYASSSGNVFSANGCGIDSATGGFIINAGSSAHIRNGHMVITNISGNIWISSHATGTSDNGGGQSGGGSVTTPATLDRVRITTTNVSQVFDAGSVNIMYEG